MFRSYSPTRDPRGRRIAFSGEADEGFLVDFLGVLGLEDGLVTDPRPHERDQDGPTSVIRGPPRTARRNSYEHGPSSPVSGS